MMKFIRLKKIGCTILAVCLACSTAVFADDSVAVLSTYKAKMTTEQGVNNFYFCSFTNENEATQLTYSTSEGQWGSGGFRIKSDVISLGSSSQEAKDIGLMFKATMKGPVLLEGKIFGPYESSGNGDGVNARIVKNNKVIWESAVTYKAPAEYSIKTSVRAGDELKFILDQNKNNGYDSFQWWPSVSYIAGDAVIDDTYSYWESIDGNETQLEYNGDDDRYHGSDGIGFISEFDVQTTERASFIKRFVVKEKGRYRIKGTLCNMDYRGNGNVVNIKKNGKLVWQQLAPRELSGQIDVRMLAEVDDTIDIEIKKNGYAGFNYAELTLDVTKIDGTIPVTAASASDGAKWAVVSEYPLSSFAGAEYYASFGGNKLPMEEASGKWTNSLDTSAYITENAIKPGSYSDVVVDLRAPKSGTVNFSGNINVSGNSDGVLAKIFVNDGLVWSNRVGGEAAARWDEPYDVKYFDNRINATTSINANDKITFLFNRWRLDTNDVIDISDIKMSYISGNPLSATTEWKLKNSIILDTASKKVRNSDAMTVGDFFVRGGTTYIGAADAEKLLGEAASGAAVTKLDGKDYLPLRAAAELCGKNVAWAADRYVLVFEGLPAMFGFSELSEIKTAEKEGVLFD